jgi:hypothetical protein
LNASGNKPKNDTEENEIHSALAKLEEELAELRKNSET